MKLSATNRLGPLFDPDRNDSKRLNATRLIEAKKNSIHDIENQYLTFFRYKLSTLALSDFEIWLHSGKQQIADKAAFTDFEEMIELKLISDQKLDSQSAKKLANIAITKGGRAMLEKLSETLNTRENTREQSRRILAAGNSKYQLN